MTVVYSPFKMVSEKLRFYENLTLQRILGGQSLMYYAETCPYIVIFQMGKVTWMPISWRPERQVYYTFSEIVQWLK